MLVFYYHLHSQWIQMLRLVNLCCSLPHPILLLYFRLITLSTNRVKQKASPLVPNQVNKVGFTPYYSTVCASPAHKSKDEDDSEQMDSHPPPTCLASPSSHSTDISPADIFSPSKVFISCYAV